ncbi:immunity protein Tsi6 family protein [Photobacterium japonica]|uniref:immunity protein Tsi6 family protein n=1 Tax=Photobacterium japonica TaxID=2910235 RepID=UPI003D15137B
MSQEALKMAVCKQALALLHAYPAAFIAPIHSSVETELTWLVAYFSGENTDHQRLHSLTFGHYAVRELSPRYSDLYSALNAAFYVAVKTREGFTVDVELLEEYLAEDHVTEEHATQGDTTQADSPQGVK